MSLEKLPSSPILSQYQVGKTTILFTQKALFHILDQHSEEKGSEKARLQKKICFLDQKEIEAVADSLLSELSSEVEFQRENGIRIPYSKVKTQISYFPLAKNMIVQIKPLAPNTFEVVSFYKKRA